MNNMTRMELFANIFSEMNFPYMAIDLIELSNALNKEEAPISWITVSLSDNTERNDAMIGMLYGLVSSIKKPRALFEYIAKSKLFNDCDNDDLNTLASKIESNPPICQMYNPGEMFVWEENSYWPLAYATLFSQLAKIILWSYITAHCEIEKCNEGQKYPAKLSTDRPPHMPTELHYAAASLGAWLGGASNFHYFILYACKPQIKDDRLNLSYAAKMMYSSTEADHFIQSGIICIPADVVLPLLEAQESTVIFGGICVNEFGIPNLPNDIVYSKSVDYSHLGFIVDKYYRTVFLGRKLYIAEALYGAKNNLRDHYDDFYSKIEYSELLRCKHNCVPIIDVKSIADISKYIKLIPTRGDGKVFFRGQTKIYTINRTDSVKKLLFGDSCSIEPSLVTYANRNNYDYDNLHFLLKADVQQELLCNRVNSQEEKSEYGEIWKALCTDPLCKLDYALMALAQHYGLPTNGLDVTTNYEVAVWFATNKLVAEKNQNGIMKYVSIKEDAWPEKKSDFPVVFVYQSVLNSTSLSLYDCELLDEFNLHALRPERQSAKFFLGAHSVHQNRLAETLVCAFRLNPGSYPTSVDFDYLFPAPEEDEAYSFMIGLDARILKKIEDIGRVNIYHES